MYFNKIRKQDAWEELGKEMNRPVDKCVSANLSWTEMAFLNAVSFLEIFFSIKLIKNSNSLGDILTDWKFKPASKTEPLYTSLLVYSWLCHHRRSFLFSFNPLEPEFYI